MMPVFRIVVPSKSKAVVIAFLGTECPLASLHAPRLAELARAYEKKGVAFFGVDSNQQDAPSSLARFARENGLPFPLLKDVGNELADRLRVERTPADHRFGQDTILYRRQAGFYHNGVLELGKAR